MNIFFNNHVKIDFSNKFILEKKNLMLLKKTKKALLSIKNVKIKIERW